MSKIKYIPDHLKNASFMAGKAGSFSGAKLRTVQAWTKEGLVESDITGTTGTGDKREYSATNCIEIGIIKSLTNSRLSLNLIKDVMFILGTKIDVEKLDKGMSDGNDCAAFIELFWPRKITPPGTISFQRADIIADKMLTLLLSASKAEREHLYLLVFIDDSGENEFGFSIGSNFSELSIGTARLIQNSDISKCPVCDRLHGDIECGAIVGFESVLKGYDKMLSINITNIADRVLEAMG